MISGSAHTSDTDDFAISAKIDEVIATLSASVASKEWASVKEFAIRLKYLQSIDLAAEAWPGQPFDH